MTVANVELAHRKDISRSRAIVNGLLDELQEMVGSDNATLLQELGDLLRSEDENGKDRLNDLYQQIISLPGRSKAMKDLTASLQSLVAMERTAYGMDKDEAKTPGQQGFVPPAVAVYHVAAPVYPDDEDAG